MTDNGVPTGRLDLVELVPSLYRLRDCEDPGRPLERLLTVLQANLAALEADIAELYTDWFVETCHEDVLARFAELLGVTLASAPAAQPVDPIAARSFAQARRRQVANALTDRRRKGTLAALDVVAAEATGWPARGQELRRRTVILQSVRHPEPWRGRLLDLSDGDGLDRLGSPLGEEAVLADVRRITAHRTRGMANPASVAVVVWRLLANGADRGEAYCVDDERHFTFDPLGRDVALAVHAQRRNPGMPPAGDLDVPTPISRRAMHGRLEDYYGPDRSVAIYVGDRPVRREQIVVADLSDREVRIGHRRIAVDPELGRFAFAARPAEDEAVTVRYRHLQPAPIGGGRYPRSVPPRTGAVVLRVAAAGGFRFRTVGEALRHWRAEADRGVRAATIEIMDDATYTERLEIRLRPNENLELRAAPRRRPVLRPLDDDHDRPERLWVDGPALEDAECERTPAARPRLTVDGITVAGHPVSLRGALGEVTFRHCTLVPARWRGDRERMATTSLDVQGLPLRLTLASCLVGRILVASPEVGYDPIPLVVTESVLDAAGGSAALEGTDRRRAYVELSMSRVTVLGAVEVRGVDVVEDCLIAGRLWCELSQVGTVRFSSLPPGSRTPRRVACQPDGVLELVDRRLPPGRRQELQAAEIRRVRPVFDGREPLDPGYARLADSAADELRRGAHDEGEMGAHHELWCARRTAELLIRLAEFTPADFDCGPVNAT